MVKLTFQPWKFSFLHPQQLFLEDCSSTCGWVAASSEVFLLETILAGLNFCFKTCTRRCFMFFKWKQHIKKDCSSWTWDETLPLLFQSLKLSLQLGKSRHVLTDWCKSQIISFKSGCEYPEKMLPFEAPQLLSFLGRAHQYLKQTQNTAAWTHTCSVYKTQPTYLGYLPLLAGTFQSFSFAFSHRCVHHPRGMSHSQALFHSLLPTLLFRHQHWEFSRAAQF